MLNVLSLFSGIGAFEKALEKLNIEHKLVAYCEIDKYASKSYSLIHNVPESMNLRDVTKVDFLDICEPVDLITYGFPCQDISLAGHGKGFRDKDGNLTRSGLFYEAARIIDDYRPKFAIAENVKALTSKRHREDFKSVLETLENIGYKNYYAVLNAKNYGIPQNRDRVFIVSIRKDIDRGCNFPEPFKLKLRLKDMLEDEVDEKYYLSDTIIKGFLASTERHKEKGTGFIWKPKTGDDVANCLRANGALCKTDNSIVVEGNIYPNSGNPQAGRIYNSNGVSPSLDTCGGGNRMPKILMPEATNKGYAEAHDGDGVYINRPHQKRVVVQHDMIQTLKTSLDVGVVVPNKEDMFNLRIRRLTPLECWRLMGFDDEDCCICSENGISNTQLYKQAGNSIVVNVLIEIFKELGKIYDEFKNF